MSKQTKLKYNIFLHSSREGKGDKPGLTDFKLPSRRNISKLLQQVGISVLAGWPCQMGGEWGHCPLNGTAKAEREKIGYFTPGHVHCRVKGCLRLKGVNGFGVYSIASKVSQPGVWGLFSASEQECSLLVLWLMGTCSSQFAPAAASTGILYLPTFSVICSIDLPDLHFSQVLSSLPTQRGRRNPSIISGLTVLSC